MNRSPREEYLQKAVTTRNPSPRTSRTGQTVREQGPKPEIPRRELVTLLAYLETGSHKAAAYRLGISESTARQRVSQLLRRTGTRTAAQAVWHLRRDLEWEIEAKMVTQD